MALQPAWLRGIPFDLWYGLAINLVSPGGPRRLAMRLNAKSLGRATNPMSQFEMLLSATNHLLLAVREFSWAGHIDRDLELWRQSRDVEHHLSIYGGMGSFNDVVLCKANSHDLSPRQEPWADTLFRHLKSLCFVLAENSGRDLSVGRLAESFGQTEHELCGWRCLSCGHAETTPRDIEFLLASRHLRRATLQALQQGRLRDLVDKILGLELTEAEPEREHLASLCLDADLPVVDRTDMMRPCPECAADDTARYRWVPNGHLNPSPDNLPLRRGAA